MDYRKATRTSPLGVVTRSFSRTLALGTLMAFTNAHEGIAQVEWKDRYVTLAEKDQTNPSVARPSNSSYTVVVWEDQRSGNRDIYVQKIDNTSGLALWEVIDGSPVCVAPYDQRNPRAAYDSLGGIIITWEDFRKDQNKADIYAMRIDVSTGNPDPMWPIDGMAICSQPTHEERPRIVGNGDGAFITWIDWRNNLGPTNRDVYAQYVLSNATIAVGTWVPDGIPVSALTAPDQINQEIASDFIWRPDPFLLPKTGFVVVYQDNRNTSSSTGQQCWTIYSNNIDASGVRQYTGIDVAVGMAPFIEGQENPQIMTTGNAVGSPMSSAVIVWQDLRNSGSGGNYDIYAQVLDDMGFSPFPMGVQISNAPNNQVNPVLTLWERPQSLSYPYAAYATFAWNDISASVFASLFDVLTMNITSPNGLSGELISLQANNLDQISIDSRSYLNYSETFIVWRVDYGLQGLNYESDIYYQGISIPSWQYLKPVNGWPVTTAKGQQSLPQASGDVFVYEDARRRPIGGAVYIDNQNDFNIYCQTPGECTGPTEMEWRDMFAKWSHGTDAKHFRMVTDPFDNSIFVVWDDSLKEVGKRLVFIQKFDKDGVPRWKNNGLLVNFDHDGNITVAERPDVCITDRGGAMVVWQQKLGGADWSIRYTEVAANGFVFMSKSVEPSLYANTPRTNPRIVHNPKSFSPLLLPGALIAYQVGQNQAPAISHRAFAQAPYRYLGNNAVISGGITVWDEDYEDIELKHDHEGGAWIAARRTNGIKAIVLIHCVYDQINVLRNNPSAGFPIPFATFGGYDMHVDIFRQNIPVPSSPVNNPNDAILAYSISTVPNTPLNVYVQRFKSGLSLAPAIPLTSNTIQTDDAKSPAISGDKLSLLIPGSNNVDFEGAIVAWDQAYASSGYIYHRLETNRVFFTEQAADPYYQSHIVFQNPIIVTNAEATDLNVDIETTPDNSQTTKTPFGMLVWESGNEQSGCNIPRPREIYSQYVRYTGNPVTAVQWYSPKLASPGGGIYSQYGPMIKPFSNGDSSVSVFWYDTRNGVVGIIGTKMYDYMRLNPLWNKIANHLSDIRKKGFTMDLYPNPMSASINQNIFVSINTVEEQWYDVAVYNTLGERVLTVFQGILVSRHHTFTLSTHGIGFQSGTYFCVIRSSGGIISMPLIVLR